MTFHTSFRAGFAGLSLIIVAACGADYVSQNSFQAKYSKARTALENGAYDRARTGYKALLPEAGPLRPRVQLEYAHTELRAGNYAEAAQLASALAQTSDGPARGAALAVQGTAQHEMGLQLLSEGDVAGGLAQLQGAKAALDEVLKEYPDLDPLGSMAGRQASIASRLGRL